jgi:hypothetical protein
VCHFLHHVNGRFSHRGGKRLRGGVRVGLLVVMLVVMRVIV